MFDAGFCGAFRDRGEGKERRYSGIDSALTRIAAPARAAGRASSLAQLVPERSERASGRGGTRRQRATFVGYVIAACDDDDDYALMVIPRLASPLASFLPRDKLAPRKPSDLSAECTGRRRAARGEVGLFLYRGARTRAEPPRAPIARCVVGHTRGRGRGEGGGREREGV